MDGTPGREGAGRGDARATRRHLLAALGAGVGVGGLAGCAARPHRSGGGEADGGDAARDGTDAGGGTAVVPAPPRRVTTVDPDAPGAFTPRPAPDGESPGIAVHGRPETICEASTNPRVVGIRAVADPAYGPDWAGVDVAAKYRLGDEDGPALGEESVVIGVRNGDRARAYPLSVVWWHEAVNDALPGPDFAGPVLVTYCPICRSGMVAERTVGGRETTFGVTGQLWQPPRQYTAASVAEARSFGASASDPAAAVRNSGNLVLYDEATRSYWSQILARAICGPQTGGRLTVLPATVTTWREWRAANPDTDVLLPPPHSGVL